MRYKVRHSTRYSYSDAVPLCQNQVRLAVRSLPYQRVERFQLVVRPEPAEVSSRIDPFGNQVDSFEIHEPHTVLSITSVSELSVRPRRPVESKRSPKWEDLVSELKTNRSAAYLDAYQYTFASPFVPLRESLGEYARESFQPGRAVMDAAIDLTARVFHDFEYDPRATTLSTPVDEVFENRRGVCQDFAHLQIAALRSLGISAKYVSGYLRTLPPPGQPRLVGADASHAWLAVYCGEAGWLHLDPTNNVVPGVDHITVAWGRDYGDVCPVRGVFVGGGQHSLAISVDVEPAA